MDSMEKHLSEWPESQALTRRDFRVGGLLLGLALIFLPSRGLAYEVAEVSDRGALRGVVTLKGAPPEPAPVLITKDPETCGHGQRVVEEVRVSGEGRLQSVVVRLEGVERGKGWDRPEEGYVLDQRGCRFLPEVLIIPQGEKLAITNSDPVPHNIHAYEVIGRARRGLFNIAQPQPGRIEKELKIRNSPIVKVECDLHNFMHGWVFVAPTPYATLTDSQGQFLLADVPPGHYVLKAWHPVIGEKELEVDVQPGKEASVLLELTAQ